MKRQKFLLGFLIILGSLGLVACTPETPEEQKQPPVIDNDNEDENEIEEEIIDLSGYDDINGRTITFFDDFDGDELDLTVWEHMIGTGAQYGLGYWGNNEQQYYQPDNTNVTDGTLQIQLRKEDILADNGTGTMMHYTSSRLRTMGSFSQKYGRFEARVKVDTMEQGLWPAFWLLPETYEYGGWPYSGEFDIMEIRGSRPYNTTAALHFSRFGHTYFSNEVGYPEGTSMSDYHVYALEWTPTRITYYVDDIIVLDIDEWQSEVGDFPAPFDQEFHILLNFAVGGNFDGNKMPSDEALPATMIVDYVRVLALDDETGRKQPEGNGDVYLLYDEVDGYLSDGYIDLEYFVFNGNKGDVAWFSSDPTVAVVNQAGRVTFLRAGTTTIRVATGTTDAECTITINSDEVS